MVERGELNFEWDEAKAVANVKKHGVTFAFGLRIFGDDFRLEIQDETLDDEERWITMGLIDGDVFVVVFTMRNPLVRIISARSAENYERRDYWENRVLQF